MKGAFSSPDGVLDRMILNSLFPDTSYSNESGGDPDEIPSLTYEDFLDFHRKYYHPPTVIFICTAIWIWKQSLPGWMSII